MPRAAGSPWLAAYNGLPWALIWHSGGMESRVDLDRVAALISRHAIAWDRAGLMVDPLTWRDVGEPWPFPLREDRSQVVEADSVGVAIRKHEQEGDS